MRARSTYVRNFYHEYNYMESGTGPNNRSVTYSTNDSSGYKDNSFFQTEDYLFVTFGGSFYWRPTNNLLLSFSPFYSYNIHNKLSLASVNYSVQPNYGGFRLSAFYLFGKSRQP